jgi:hypothetical protein
MSEYVLEIVRGKDHMYLGRKESGRIKVTPQERNAITFNTCTEAKQVIDSLMGMPVADMRKLLKVDEQWERSVHLLARKRLGSANTTVNSRLYQFTEKAA